MLNNNKPPELPKTNNKRSKKREYPVLSKKAILQLIEEKCSNVCLRHCGKGNAFVIILPEAWEHLKRIIGMGKTTPFNIYEQLYYGIGHCFINTNGKPILVISHFYQIYAADRTSASACIFEDEIDSTLDRIHNEIRIYNENELRCNTAPNGTLYDPFVEKYGKSEILLYGHTHPNIGVFFSSTDKKSNFATADFPSAIFVADPIRKTIKAAVGVNAESAQIIVCQYKTTREKGKNIVIEPSSTKLDKNQNIIAKTDKELVSALSSAYKAIVEASHDTKGRFIIKNTCTNKERISISIERKYKKPNKDKSRE